MSKETIHIVGSGLVGSLTAVFLGQKGFKVELYEHRPDMRKAEISAGRSINLVITDRGLKAAEQVGLKDKIMEITIPMKGRMLHDIEGQETFVPYGQKDNEVINSISRGLLNCLLMDAAEEDPNVNLHFDHQCTGYDIESSTLSFKSSGNGKEHKIKADVTIGADGAFSSVRKAMLDQMMNFNYVKSL